MPPIIAEPVILESIAYYDIVARSEPDIVRALNAKGPGGQGANRYWGRADWTAGWDFRTRRTREDRCVVDGADLSLTIVITLPRWTPDADVAPGVVEKWNRLSAALLAHEHEHAANGREAIAAVVSRMRADPGARTCPALRETLEADAQALIRRGWDRDRALDERTGHGSTEGVSIQW